MKARRYTDDFRGSRPGPIDLEFGQWEKNTNLSPSPPASTPLWGVAGEDGGGV
jgi:hypothetical protein